MAVETGERIGAGSLPARVWRAAVPSLRAPGRLAGAWPGGAGVAGRLARLPARVGGKLADALAAEAARGTGFVAFTGLFAAGAVAYFSLPFEPAFSVLLALLAAAAGGVLVSRGGGAARVAAVALLAVLLGLAAGRLETWRADTRMAGSEISTRLTARIVAIEDRGGGRARLTLDVIATERPALRFAPERMRATARAVPETLLPGQTVVGVVRLLPATGPVRPGAFDFSFDSYFSGIGASGFFLSGPFPAEEIAEAAAGQRAAAAVERFRERLADHIRSRIAGPEGEIAAALIAGTRGGIAEADNEALRRTGLAHFISISGLHMALVAAIVLVAMRSAFALFPVFASRHPVKKYAAATALVATAAYLVISGQQVAAQRSFLMLAVMLTAVLFDRAALTMRNLAISALIILAVVPHEIMGPSFQMSFAATAALIAAYAWYAQRRRARPSAPDTGEKGMARRLARTALVFFGGLAATSVVAGLATTIFGVWHFQRVSPLGLVANLAAMPIVSAVVMPAAVAGSLLIPLGLDAPVFAVMGWGLATVMDIARWLSDNSPIDAVGAISPAAVLLLSAGLAVVTAATTAPLRALCLPFFAAGLSLVAMRELPHMLVSEDARLVAMALEDGRLAANRRRPSSFTIWNWSHAMAADGFVRPVEMAKAGADAEAGWAALLGGNGPALPTGELPFHCDAGLCLARHAGGAVVAHAANAAAAGRACGIARLIVIDDATAGDPCGASGTAVVTKRELALRGSAAVRFAADGAARIVFAISETPRIWHQQRRFSREARGLAPWRRAEARAGAGTE